MDDLGLYRQGRWESLPEGQGVKGTDVTLNFYHSFWLEQRDKAVGRGDANLGDDQDPLSHGCILSTKRKPLES